MANLPLHERLSSADGASVIHDPSGSLPVVAPPMPQSLGPSRRSLRPDALYHAPLLARVPGKCVLDALPNVQYPPGGEAGGLGVSVLSALEPLL